MITKVCGVCKQELSLSMFWKRGTGVQPNCITCQKELNKERYNGDKRKYHIDRVKTNNKKRRDLFLLWKSTLACSVCGETHRNCIDFHHLNPLEKDSCVGDVAGSYGINRIKEEIAKCAILCKNCHVKVHDGIIILTKEQEESGIVAKDGLHLTLNQE